MPVPRENLASKRGDTVPKSLEAIEFENGDAVNWVGANAFLTAKRKLTDSDAAAVFQLTAIPADGLTIIAAENRIDVVVAPSKTAALTKTESLHYDVQVVQADGRVGTVKEGTWTVTLDVTIGTDPPGAPPPEPITATGVTIQWNGTQWVPTSFAFPLDAPTADDVGKALIVSAAAQTAFARLAVNPDIVTLRNATASALAAVLASGTEDAPNLFRLLGTFTVDATLDLSAFNHLEIDATAARIITTLAPDVADADNADNCLVKVASTERADLFDQPLTATALPGTTTVTLASTAGLTAGDYILLHGASSTNLLGHSAPINYDFHEVLRVGSVDSGTQITTTTRVKGFYSHVAAPFPACRITKIDVCRNIRWIGGHFDCSSGAIANGILLRSALGIRVEGAEFKGFSRAGIDVAEGTSDWRISDVKHLGENNALIFAEDVGNGTLRDVDSCFDGAFSHANGIPRAVITLRQRCIDVTVRNVVCRRAALGIQVWSNWNIVIDGWRCEDLDGSLRAPVLAAGLDQGIGTRLGVAFDGGCNAVGVFSVIDGPLQITNGQIGSHKQANSDQVAFYIHDWTEVTISNVTIHNRGSTVMRGMVLSDVYNLNMSNVECRGVTDTIKTDNSGCPGANFVNLNFVGTAGTVIATDALRFGHTGGSRMNFTNCTFAGYNLPYVRFEGNYISASDGWITFDNVVWDNRRFGFCTIVKNGTATNVAKGEIVELDAAVAAVPPAAPTIKTAPTAGGFAGGLVKASDDTVTSTWFVAALAAPGTQSYVRCGTGAIAVGDLIRHDANRLGVADNAADAKHVLGRALESKAAGAAGLIKVG